MVTARKLIVEVVDAHNLMPKDGHGASSPFVDVKFGLQHRRTQSKVRNLNLVWNEMLSFDVDTPQGIPKDVLKLKVKHDNDLDPIQRSNTLGRVILDPTKFLEKGKEALVYYRLKRGILKNVKGDIGLKVYFVNELLLPPQESMTEPPQVEPMVVEELPQDGDRPKEVPPENENEESLAPPKAEMAIEPNPKPKLEPELEQVLEPSTAKRTDQGNPAPPRTSIFSYIFELRRLLLGSSIFCYVVEWWKHIRSNGAQREAPFD